MKLVRVGQVFERTSAAPGYSPVRLEVVRVDDDGWCWVVWRPGGAERPHRQETLQDPRLYRRVQEGTER